MCKFSVVIKWSDGIDSDHQFSPADGIGRVAEYISNEISRIGNDGEYPEGIYPTQILIEASDG